jgi:penicillin-binding protein 2
VDSHGREVGILGREPAVPGQGLKLTIDLDLQRAAEAAMGDRNGAIVAIDPHTGAVLALVSRPSFDPNDFSVRVSREEWNKLITDPRHPLLDKAIQAQLAPGSTFKIIMSLAGLENNIAQELRVNCAGGALFYGRFFGCDKHHGLVDINHAIPMSCDTYYYTLAERLGIEKIAYWAHKVGIGQKTGIDLPGEATGIMPSEEWKMKTFHEKWYAGEVISVGIGQGAVAVTPIQLVRAVAGIASGGVFKRPHVVEADQLPEEYRQAMYDSYPGTGDATVPIRASTWETITDGMAGALDAHMGGTAAASHMENIDFAGKTGTAQVVNHSAGSDKVSADVATRANAWFVGIAPRRNPDIAVVVLVEHGGWGNTSAPLAARIIETFVDKQRRLDNNLQEAQVPSKVEVGAVWNQPPEPGVPAPAATPAAAPKMQGGHFELPVHSSVAAKHPAAAASQVAAVQR